jgi:trimethylamine--corrinoid protein Co-methyltransferase
MLKGFTRSFKPLEILTEEQIAAIHRATLDVLAETGLRIEHERALKLYERNGCKVDYDDMRVRFPPGLVEECLRKCPSSFHIDARDPKSDVNIGGNAVYFVTFPGMESVDLDTWERRAPTRKENYDAVTVIDSLDNLHYLTPYTPWFGFAGVPPAMAIPESFASKIRGTTKIGFTGYTLGSEVYVIRMAQAVGAEVTGYMGAAPPLTFYTDAMESLFRFVEAGLPIITMSGAVYGGNAPATITGAVVANNAEELAEVVLAQLIRPRTRVIACDFSFPQNMRTGAPAFGGIGISLHQAIFNQIWRKYGVPTYTCGGPGSAKEIDLQCGYERGIMAILSALSGANLIGMHGGIHGEITWHPVMAILDDDIAGMVGRFIEGVEVDDETIALDLIKEVGPIPGFYLDKEHTRRWWKKEQFVPRAADRLTYPEWTETGKKSALDYAKERMEEILDTHKVDPPLTPEQEQAIEDVLKEAREYYREKGMISDAEMEEYRKVMGKVHYPYV